MLRRILAVADDNCRGGGGRRGGRGEEEALERTKQDDEGSTKNAACEAMKVKEYIKIGSGYTSSFFSASWLRSSVVSVLIRLITDIQSLTGPDHITICSGYVRLACQETYMCDLVLAQLRGCTPS